MRLIVSGPGTEVKWAGSNGQWSVAGEQEEGVKGWGLGAGGWTGTPRGQGAGNSRRTAVGGFGEVSRPAPSARSHAKRKERGRGLTTKSTKNTKKNPINRENATNTENVATCMKLGGVKTGLS